MQDLDQIFHLIEGYYSGSQEATDFINSSFLTNIDNLEMCKTILEMPDISDHCKTFASDAFRNIISRFLGYFDYRDEADQIVGWIINFLTSTEAQLPDIYYRDLGRSVSLICAKFYESNRKDIEYSLKQLSIFFNTDPSLLIHGIQIHEEILIAFLESNDRTFDLFKFNYLYVIYICEKEILRRTDADQDPIFSLQDADVRKLIHESCITFSKCICFRKEQDKLASHSSRDLKADLADKEFPLFIFQLFEKFMEPAALDIISSYFQITSSSFMKMSNYFEIVDAICFGLSHIIQEQIGFDDITVLRSLSIALYNLSTRIDLDMVTSLENLRNLIDEVTQFSIESFQRLANEMDIIENIVGFWPNLEKVCEKRSSDAEQAREYIGSKVFDIYSVYIQMILNGSIEPENKIVDIDVLNDHISTFILPIHSFLILNPPPIYEHLMNIYQEKKAEFVQCLSNNYELDNIQKQIAVFLQIFIKILQSNTFNEKESSYINRICVETFCELFTICEMTLEPLSEKIIFPEIEMCLSLFIASTVFDTKQVRIEYQDAFYREVSSLIPIPTHQSSQDKFIQRIISAIQSFYESDYSEKHTIITNLLNKLAQKVVPSDELIQQLLQTNLDETFNFMQNSYYRTLFMSSIMSIISKLGNSVLYDTLIAHFDAKFEELASPENILLLATDIRGLFRANLNLSDFLIQFNTFFPEKMKLFVEAFGSMVSSSPDLDINIINMSLKMCKSIIVRPSSKRIEFDKNSANGIILFTFAAQLISIFINYMENNSDNQKFLEDFAKSEYREFKCCTKILSSLLSGGYVPFEAFFIYEDSVFASVLSDFVQLFNTFDLDDFCSYPNAFNSLINFFKELCSHQIRLLCNQFPADFLKGLMAMIFECSIRGITMLNEASRGSIVIITNIVKFIFEEQHTKEAEILVDAINGEDLGRANACLWEVVFNSSNNSEVNLVGEPIKYFIMINEEAFGVIREKILEIAEKYADPEIQRSLEIFEKGIEDAVDSESGMIILLNQLKRSVNQKVVSVSIL